MPLSLFFSRVLLLALLGWLPLGALATPPFEDSMAERTQACVACHGQQGRAGPDGYYPRLAGKPAGYLYAQLLNFREGRRHYGLMTGLVETLSDSYLLDIAQFFAKQDAPYPPPQPTTASQDVLNQGRLLATKGDATRNIPACTQCHGLALTGVTPNVPGLLGLPRDYLNAQLGGWQTGQRRTRAPDCMAHIAGQLTPHDIAAVTSWLAAQHLPANTHPVPALPRLAQGEERLDCGAAARLPAKATPTSALIAQGAYLARAGNCISCHTAKGGAPFAGGRSIKTPFGTVFSSNLTSDNTTGLGRWTASDFWRAMQEGRSKDGRLLNPAFPYPNFTQVTRADTDALFAYLQTVKPIQQANTAQALQWPFGTQTALAVWRTLFFSPGTYQPDEAQGLEWNRGAYLVRGLGHCGACHTPRNELGGSKNQLDLAGGMIPMQRWYAPSLRAREEAGVTHDTRQPTATLLKSGVSARGSAQGPMAEVVRNSTQYLTPNDLNAMTLYLASLAAPAALPSPKPGPSDAQSRQVPGRGAKLYDTYCAQCHGRQGEGIKGAYAPLAHNRAVTLNNTANLVHVVLYGGYAPATADNPRPFGMPPFILKLTDKDTAAVLTYIRNSWGNQAPKVTEFEVTRARDQP